MESSDPLPSGLPDDLLTSLVWLDSDISLDAKTQDIKYSWSTNAFKARVLSFKSHFWFSKPLLVRATVCASLGWNCVGEDLISCEECQRKLAFKTSTTSQTPLSSATVNMLAQTFVEKMKTGHHEFCSRNSSDPFRHKCFASQREPMEHVLDILHRLSLVETPACESRVSSAFWDKLIGEDTNPGVSLEDLKGHSLREAMLSSAVHDSKSTVMQFLKTQDVRLALALSGFVRTSECKYECEYCFAQLHLRPSCQSFKRRRVSEGLASSASLARDENAIEFDPMQDSHQYFCEWTKPYRSSKSVMMYAWSQLQRYCQSPQTHQTSSELRKQTLSSIRQLLMLTPANSQSNN